MGRSIVEPRKIAVLWRRVEKSLSRRFNLLQDRAPSAAIDLSFRSGVELLGTTPWVLMIAIFIASIGLNVNSTAVIIGAMLISPLMGPIMGLGYGLGIYDFGLVKKSMLNIGITALISLATSSLYFVLSPLSEAQSELLARTSPTIWDVLIAFFGGLAGAIGSTRKEKTNLIPGVAIATALMPPLCTAGYGIAQGSLTFFLGALYLFTINSVFIAISTMIVTRYLKLKVLPNIESSTEKRMRRLVVGAAVLTTLPSVILAYDLVQQEIFNKKARHFLRQEFDFAETHVAATKIVARKKRIEISLLGKPVNKEILDLIKTKLPAAGLGQSELVIHQGFEQDAPQKIDLNAIKENILSEVYKDTLSDLKIAQAQVTELQKRLDILTQGEATTEAILREIAVQYPEASIVSFGYHHAFDETAKMGGSSIPSGETKKVLGRKIPIVTLKTSRNLLRDEQIRLENWLRQRTGDSGSVLIVEQDKRGVAIRQKGLQKTGKKKI